MTVNAEPSKEKTSEYVQLGTAEAVAVPVDTSTSVAAARAVTMAEVVAPADLKEGYTFEADVNGQRFPVVVPEGGVSKGQRFTVPISGDSSALKLAPATMGRWKDGLCNCCVHGPCHPHFCLAWWCRPLALAQVMTRMRLNWIAEPGSVQEVAKTFRTVFIIFLLYLTVDYVLNLVVLSLVPDPEYYVEEGIYETEDVPTAALIAFYARRLIEFLFAVYLLLATCRTRQAVRSHYNIPEENCGGCEDCCCSFWCGCCTVMQMMRQTADYDTYSATCCTDTGLPPHAPQIV